MLGIEKEYKGLTIKSGIINLRNVSDGVLEGIFKGKNSLTRNEMQDYKTKIILLINRILDKNTMFEN